MLFLNELLSFIAKFFVTCSRMIVTTRQVVAKQQQLFVLVTLFSSDYHTLLFIHKQK